MAWDSVDIGESTNSLDDEATIREADAATISLDSFRTNSSFFSFGDQVVMTDEEITVVFYFEDRERLAVTFTPD